MRYPSFVLSLALVATAFMACEDETSLAPNGTVNINGQNFDPSTVALTGGNRTVTFGIFSGGPHQITFQDGVTSGLRASGAWQRIFAPADTAGLYRFRCEQHSTDFQTGMIGQVILP